MMTTTEPQEVYFAAVLLFVGSVAVEAVARLDCTHPRRCKTLQNQFLQIFAKVDSNLVGLTIRTTINKKA